MSAPRVTRTEKITRPQARRAAVAAMAASSIEWYDFFIYATAAALVFPTAFFPTADPVTGVLASFATFAVGFLARPIGGVISGHFGDKLGRKPVLVASMVIMGAATTLIGLLPIHATLGVVAPILLVTLRFVQGLAVGAQWGGAMLVATEFAPPGRRGLFGSFVQLGVPLGLIAGNLTFLVLAQLVTPAEFVAWGWRIPFVLSVFLIGLALFVHHKLEETPAFRRAEQKLAASQNLRHQSPVVEVLRRHPKQVLLAAGAFMVVNATFYLMVTGLLDYGTRTLGLSKNDILIAVLISNAAQIITLPLFAGLSDRLGRRRMYAAGAVLLAVWAFPMFTLIDTGSVPLIVLSTVVAATCLSMMYGPQAALFSEMFSARVRYSGASLGYQIAAVLGGGLAPMVMVLLLESTGTSMSLSVYIAVMAGIALLSLWLITETHDPDKD